MRYYHATPRKNISSIIDNGLENSVATECECGSGVHVTETIDDCYGWISRLREERDELYYVVFTILEIEVNDSQKVVKDDFIGINPDSYIICTDNSVSTERIRVVEDVD